MVNKEFIKKIIKAEKYKYEAIKEVMPNNIRKKVEELEKDTLDLLKDAVIEIMKEDLEEEKSKKVTKKIDVNFS